MQRKEAYGSVLTNTMDLPLPPKTHTYTYTLQRPSPPQKTTNKQKKNRPKHQNNTMYIPIFQCTQTNSNYTVNVSRNLLYSTCTLVD